LEQNILSFQGDVSSELKWTPLSLTIPPSSPFASESNYSTIKPICLDRF
jgi:hypothetical protein